MRTLALSLAFGLSIGLVLPACASSQEGKLYRHDGAAAATFRIANTSSISPVVVAELEGGVSCRGRLARIYESGPSVAVDGAPEAESSVAVLACSSQAILKCRLSRESDSGYAFGECADQHGRGYTIVF